jgi:hypothetical protein
MNDVFNQFDEALSNGGIDGLLSAAEAHFRNENRFHELFEILKMQTRQRLGLPLVHEEGEELTEDAQRALEDGLLEACCEIGLLLLRSGQVQDSWHYLRHLSDNGIVLSELESIEVDENNLDQILGLLLHEGLDTERGYRLVLEHYGTCNAITTLQSTLYGRAKKDRQAAGRLLVAHVHAELVENVRAHIQREEGDAPTSSRLADLLSGRDFLFTEGCYHLDTSHLSSTVQIAGELTDGPSLELALELTEYGRRLDQQLQYAGDPPFEENYQAHHKLFQAQLARNVDESLAYFRERAEATDARQEGTYPIEVYIDLLARLSRFEEAIDASIQLIPEGIQTTGRAPSIYELSTRMNNFDRFRQLCRKRTDALGYLLSISK